MASSRIIGIIPTRGISLKLASPSFVPHRYVSSMRIATRFLRYLSVTLFAGDPVEPGAAFSMISIFRKIAKLEPNVLQYISSASSLVLTLPPYKRNYQFRPNCFTLTCFGKSCFSCAIVLICVLPILLKDEIPMRFTLFFIKLVYGIQIILNFCSCIKDPLEYQKWRTRKKKKSGQGCSGLYWKLIGGRLGAGLHSWGAQPPPPFFLAGFF